MLKNSRVWTEILNYETHVVQHYAKITLCQIVD